MTSTAPFPQNREAVYFRRHFPTRPVGDNWRVRVKYSPAWKDLVALYGPKRAFLEGAKVLERYLEDCRSLQQETVRSLNLDPKRIEAEASDDEEFTVDLPLTGALAPSEGETKDGGGKEEEAAAEERKEGSEARGAATVVSSSTEGSTSASDSSDGETDDEDDDNAVGLGGVVLEGMTVTGRGVHQF